MPSHWNAEQYGTHNHDHEPRKKMQSSEETVDSLLNLPKFKAVKPSRSFPALRLKRSDLLLLTVR